MLTSNSDIFEIENLLTPSTDILKGGYWGILHWKWAKYVISFTFLGWGLRVVYNSDSFEKSRPHPGFKKFLNLIWKFFGPLPIGKYVWIFLYFSFDASPNK